MNAQGLKDTKRKVVKLLEHSRNDTFTSAPRMSIETSIRLESLLVAEARGNHPISRYSANQIAPFQPRDTAQSEFLSTLTKVEMATELQ